MAGVRPGARRRRAHPTSWRWTLAVAVLALVAVPVTPAIGVFLTIVALNHLLGEAENVPFSRYSMFSRPSRRAWALRFEDDSGAPLNIGIFGILPPAARKRFAGDVQAARGTGMTLEEARTVAATSLAEWIDEHRPVPEAAGRDRITIALIDYQFDGTEIVATRRTLATTRPC